jgi:hypothetical protein
MQPAPVTPLVEQLAAHTKLGYPQAGYILNRTSRVSAAVHLLLACFMAWIFIRGLAAIGPALLGCLLLGLYLFLGVRWFSSTEWYICPAGFIRVENGEGEAVRWDQVEEFKWDTEPDDNHPGGTYRFRRSDGKEFWIYWPGDWDLYVNMGYEFELAITKARSGQLNRPLGQGLARDAQPERELPGIPS